MEIHIKDNDPHSLSKNGGLEDVSLVEKYEISEEAYEKREQTVRKEIAKKKVLFYHILLTKHGRLINNYYRQSAPRTSKPTHPHRATPPQKRLGIPIISAHAVR